MSDRSIHAAAEARLEDGDRANLWGADEEAVRVVCLDDDQTPFDAEVFVALLRRGLVRQVPIATRAGVDSAAERAESGTRYGMLHAYREFARDQLRADARHTAARDRHLAWFVAQASSVTGAPFGSGREQRLAALAIDRANLFAALAWADAAGSPAAIRQLTGALALIGFPSKS